MTREQIINSATEEIFAEIISGDVENRTAVNKKTIYWILASMAADLQILWIDQQQETLEKRLNREE